MSLKSIGLATSSLLNIADQRDVQKNIAIQHTVYARGDFVSGMSKLCWYLDE